MTALFDHLATGLTHVCRCWAISRTDGVILGFTDHDRPIQFEGITFAADSGMNAKAIASGAGLSVDNTEAVGILTANSITASDIAAGRYDDADVTIWRVRWDDPAARHIQFRGKMGEISRSGGSFRAELRGLSEQLNQPQGRAFLRRCSAVLGDQACKADVTGPAFRAVIEVDEPSDGQDFDLVVGGFAAEWFVGGMMRVMTGAAAGLSGVIKSDEIASGRRHITLWEPIRQPIAIGDTVELTAGCDKQLSTCHEKFANLLNFQGFPHIPGDDWLVSVPRSDDDNTGEALF